MHLVLEGLRAVLITRYIRFNSLRVYLDTYSNYTYTVCLGSNPNLRIVANSQMDKALDL